MKICIGSFGEIPNKIRFRHCHSWMPRFSGQLLAMSSIFQAVGIHVAWLRGFSGPEKRCGMKNQRKVVLVFFEGRKPENAGKKNNCYRCFFVVIKKIGWHCLLQINYPFVAPFFRAFCFFFFVLVNSYSRFS